MKVTKKPKPKRYTGECRCGTHIKVNENDRALKTLVDRDSPEGAMHVRCPNCKDPYLWVS